MPGRLRHLPSPPSYRHWHRRLRPRHQSDHPREALPLRRRRQELHLHQPRHRDHQPLHLRCRWLHRSTAYHGTTGSTAVPSHANRPPRPSPSSPRGSQSKATKPATGPPAPNRSPRPTDQLTARDNGPGWGDSCEEIAPSADPEEHPRARPASRLDPAPARNPTCRTCESRSRCHQATREPSSHPRDRKTPGPAARSGSARSSTASVRPTTATQPPSFVTTCSR